MHLNRESIVHYAPSRSNFVLTTVPPTPPTPKDGQYPLHLACAQGSDAIVEVQTLLNPDPDPMVVSFSLGLLRVQLHFCSLTRRTSRAVAVESWMRHRRRGRQVRGCGVARRGALYLWWRGDDLLSDAVLARVHIRTALSRYQREHSATLRVRGPISSLRPAVTRIRLQRGDKGAPLVPK